MLIVKNKTKRGYFASNLGRNGLEVVFNHHVESISSRDFYYFVYLLRKTKLLYISKLKQQYKD